jgi:hypothetical protein
VLPQGSVKAKPSAAIGAALGPHLVLPNGNVSGPRACAPVEAFDLPGSVAKGGPIPAPVANGGTSFDLNLATLADAPSEAATPRPAANGTIAAPTSPPSGGTTKPGAPPKAKGKPRPLFEGEERKRGPAGRTSMYKVLILYLHMFIDTGPCRRS